ncbi:MAG: hypothetical protein QNJ72_33495 [Pleurocapsa sp. MO_226.B13]|nr:hypothetical protein [Pleurocapsa sp. MO_226.B13]
MKRRYREHKNFSLEPETIRTIETKAITDGDSNGRTLDKIVAEWLEFTTDRDSLQQDASKDLESIKKRLSRLEMIIDYRAYQSYDVIKSFFPPLLEEESE